MMAAHNKNGYGMAYNGKEKKTVEHFYLQEDHD